MDFFKDMVDSGILDIGNDLDMECLWFCIESFLQDELYRTRIH